jgi:ubiquinone/menaquinone biosynthesis C-methylase UbiE
MAARGRLIKLRSGACQPAAYGVTMRSELAAAFRDSDVAHAYQHRPPYPPEVFDILEGLIADRPGGVLDIGAGDGALARPLASRVDRVDALDISAAMLTAGARLPGGDGPNLRWLLGAAETAQLDGPYALVTAGASLHWMDWDVALARLATVMTDRAQLAIVDQSVQAAPWQDDIRQVIIRHSRSRDYDPGFSLPDELSARGLLEITGSAATQPVQFRQPVADYIEQFHSTASLARLWMPAEESAAFGHAVEHAVGRYATNGILEMTVVATLTWGRPAPGRSQ